MLASAYVCLEHILNFCLKKNPASPYELREEKKGQCATWLVKNHLKFFTRDFMRAALKFLQVFYILLNLFCFFIVNICGNLGNAVEMEVDSNAKYSDHFVLTISRQIFPRPA